MICYTKKSRARNSVFHILLCTLHDQLAPRHNAVCQRVVFTTKTVGGFGFSNDPYEEVLGVTLQAEFGLASLAHDDRRPRLSPASCAGDAARVDGRQLSHQM